MRHVPLLMIACFLSHLAVAQESSKPLMPADAAKKVNEKVTVEFEVKSTGGGRNRYLNSASDFSAANNFTAYIPQAALPKFAEAKITMPDEHYYGKVIQVTGTVTAPRDKAQITVSDPAQIKIIESKSGP